MKIIAKTFISRSTGADYPSLSDAIKKANRWCKDKKLSVVSMQYEEDLGRHWGELIIFYLGE